jgi:hypothetical protein
VKRFVAFLAVTLLAGPALPHDRTTSYSSWTISPREARVVLALHQADVVNLRLAGDDALAQYVGSRLGLWVGGDPCPMTTLPRRLAASPGRIRFEWAIAVPSAADLDVRSNLFAESGSGHLHFASLYVEGRLTERVLTASDSAWRIASSGDVASDRAAPSGFRRYVVLGMDHIANGYDHLVFLFALLLAGGTFGSVARVVTGFTVGHSITLALAAFDVVRPQRDPIEALIGLSIALVAIENVWLLARRDRLLPIVTISILVAIGCGAAWGWGRIPPLCWIGLVLFLGCYYSLVGSSSVSDSARWAVALIFGLVHGFGFAAVLQEGGLPADRLATALVGFNVGVEAGQVVLIAIAWPFLWMALTRWHASVVEVGSAIAVCLGTYWMVSRNFG